MASMELSRMVVTWRRPWLAVSSSLVRRTTSFSIFEFRSRISVSRSLRSPISRCNSRLAVNSLVVRSTTLLSNSWLSCKISCCARFRSVISNIALRTQVSPAIRMGFNPISTGNSVPSFRSPKRSRPAPMDRASGRDINSARTAGCPRRNRSGTSTSTS